MNKVILMGRLAADPVVRYTQGAEPMAIARYTLAVDRRTKDGGADFISCIAFRKAGEFAEKFLKKGTKVVISGHIQTGSYEKNGNKVYTTDVIIDEQEFAESKASAGEAQKAEPKTDANGFMSIPDGIDEELPFI